MPPPTDPAPRGAARHWPAALACWALATACLAAALPGVWQGRLPDTDDYMRVVQVLDWIDTGSWHVPREMRIDPPHGIAPHWSRLPDMPIAAAIMLVEPWLGRTAAVTAAAAAVPGALLLALFAILPWVARPWLGRRGAVAVLVAALFALPAFAQFAPGRVDHHGWQLLLAMVSLGCLGRSALRPAALAPPLIGAGAMGASLWIGGEIVPWLIGVQAAYAGLWLRRGDAARRAGLTFAAALTGCAVLLLSVALPSAQWLVPACDAFSVAYVSFAAAGLVFWIVVSVLARHAAAGRRFASAGVALALGAGLVIALHPECLNGPYGAVDPRLAVWLDSIQEMTPLARMALVKPFEAAFFLFAPLLGLAVAAVRAVRARGRTRALWAVSAGMLSLAILVSLVQVRFAPYASLAAVVPVAAAIRSGWHRTEHVRLMLPRVAARIVLLLAVTPLPVLLVQGAFGGVASPPGAACDLRRAAAVLEDMRKPDGRPLVLAGFIDMGAELLFRTPHTVLAAPYHRNGRGNLAAGELLRAPDDDAALAIVRARDVDAILLCPGAPEMRLYRAAAGETIAERLAAGAPPPWLAEIPLPAADGVRLFRVHLPPEP